MARLEGKVALVTGGASGFGEAIARLFREHGAKVCILDVHDNLGHLVCDSLGGDPNVCFVHCDVTSEDDVIRAVDFTAAKYGTIDIMVNNAGITGKPTSDIRQVDLTDFKKVFDVNLNGVFLGMKHAARYMIPQGKGSIISMASVAGVIGGLGPHGYTASKHAVIGLTKSMAAELGRHGIRVNCVSPYLARTNILLQLLPTDENIEKLASDVIEDFVSLARSSTNLKGDDLVPDDVARAALYLAGDEAKFVSGLNLILDGGFSSVNHSFKTFQ